MANGTIINANKVLNGTLTPANSSIDPQLTIKQFGRVVSINGFVRNVSVGSNVSMGTISGVDAPPDVIRTVGGVANQPYQHPEDVAYITLGTNGNLSLTSTASGTKSVYFSFTYIATT